MILFILVDLEYKYLFRKFDKPFLCSAIFSLHRKGLLKNADTLEESTILESSLDTKPYFKRFTDREDRLDGCRVYALTDMCL